MFAGLDIMKHKAFCAEWMNQYPVMSLSLKDVEGLTFADAYDMLKGRISNLCIRHLSLAESDKIAPADREIFQKLTYKTASMAEIKASLETVMRMMKAVYGKPVILLIDERRTPGEGARGKESGVLQTDAGCDPGSHEHGSEVE